MSKSTVRKITQADRKAAERLKSAYRAKKREMNLTYEKVSEKCGWSSGSAVSQFMNVSVPLNMDALLKICGVLGENALEIYPEMFSGHDMTTVISPDEVSRAFHETDEITQKAIRVLLSLN